MLRSCVQKRRLAVQDWQGLVVGIEEQDAAARELIARTVGHVSSQPSLLVGCVDSVVANTWSMRGRAFLEAGRGAGAEGGENHSLAPLAGSVLLEELGREEGNDDDQDSASRLPAPGKARRLRLPVIPAPPTSSQRKHIALAGAWVAASSSDAVWNSWVSNYTAFHLYEWSHKMGTARAARRMGDCHLEGWPGDCEKNLTTAVRWYQRAVALMDGHAAVSLATLMAELPAPHGTSSTDETPVLPATPAQAPVPRNFSEAWLSLDDCLQRDYLGWWPVAVRRVQLIANWALASLAAGGGRTTVLAAAGPKEDPSATMNSTEEELEPWRWRHTAGMMDMSVDFVSAVLSPLPPLTDEELRAWQNERSHWFWGDAAPEVFQDAEERREHERRQMEEYQAMMQAQGQGQGRGAAAGRGQGGTSGGDRGQMQTDGGEGGVGTGAQAGAEEEAGDDSKGASNQGSTENERDGDGGGVASFPYRFVGPFPLLAGDWRVFSLAVRAALAALAASLALVCFLVPLAAAPDQLARDGGRGLGIQEGGSPPLCVRVAYRCVAPCATGRVHVRRRSLDAMPGQSGQNQRDGDQ